MVVVNHQAIDPSSGNLARVYTDEVPRRHAERTPTNGAPMTLVVQPGVSLLDRDRVAAPAAGNPKRGGYGAGSGWFTLWPHGGYHTPRGPL